MGIEHRFRPAHPEFSFSQIAEQFTEEITISDAGYNLEPNHFILGWTLESIRIPMNHEWPPASKGKAA